MKLTEAQVTVLYQRGLIENTTCYLALRALRGDLSISGRSALRMCEVAIEALVERAVDAACALIQDKLGVQTGDLAAAVLSDGTIERELTRYVQAELEVQTTSTCTQRSKWRRSTLRRHVWLGSARPAARFTMTSTASENRYGRDHARRSRP